MLLVEIRPPVWFTALVPKASKNRETDIDPPLTVRVPVPPAPAFDPPTHRLPLTVSDPMPLRLYVPVLPELYPMASCCRLDDVPTVSVPAL
jgi:hypothetical protein